MKLPQEPDAYAELTGSEEYPEIQGCVKFYDTYEGTIVAAEVTGIRKKNGEEENGFLGFHIHEGGRCGGKAGEPFDDAGGHFNPGDKPHPMHAGDLPPLLVSGGAAWMMVYTGRFFPEDVIGRTVIIHGMPDDFHSQPAGDAGMRIACGQISLYQSSRTR